MKIGLFINTRQANCSIYESGGMFYRAILSKFYRVDYVEVNHLDKEKLFNGEISCNGLQTEYDFYIFNYHPLTMRQLEGIDSSKLKNLKGKKISIIFEMNKDDAFPAEFNLNQDDFDDYIVLDPTFNSPKKNIHAFPRPITKTKKIAKINSVPEVPIIGSYGFPNVDKNFNQIIQQASIEFEQSIVRINIPHASYMGREITDQIINDCLKVNAPNVYVQFTHNFMTEDELIDWCSGNHLNVFLYSRSMPGLAATPDQVISSGAPLLVSNNTTFRHLHPYIGFFPEVSFRQAILESQKGIKKIREDWSREVFIKKINEIIFDIY